MRTRTAIAAALAALLLTGPASAASNSAQMQVSVRVVPNCRITVTDLSFGSYDPLVEHASQHLDGTAQVRVACTKNERATILMDERGTPARSLRSGSYELNYDIFSDSARTQPWRSGSQGVQLTFEKGSDPHELTVFGRIPRGQVVPAGTYLDSVTATVDF
jgi:spore coat protein U-like protein